MSYPEQEQKASIFLRAVESLATAFSTTRAAAGGRPVLVGPDGRPVLSASYYQPQRAGAKRSGSMKTWIPRQIGSDQEGTREREFLASRAIDLVANDPHAAGAVDSFATTIIGSGLNPYPAFTPIDIGFAKDQKEETNEIKRSIRNEWRIWSKMADAGERMTFGGLQFLAMASIVQHGECLFLLPMIQDPARFYSLGVQAINPLRLKTPIDKLSQGKIRDGIEIGEYGQPIAYWIKRADSIMGKSADTSANFVRIPARNGYRRNVIHLFFSNSNEQLRGVPWFAPAIKMFRDLNDYLDAELVSNVVTAAFALFIEVAELEPSYPAASMAGITENVFSADGTPAVERYEELIPGRIMYGGTGEKPHVISAQRPGSTFGPFIKVIEKAISMALGIPHPVLFRDFEGMNYASYRSAMLEAWRVYKSRRAWFANGFCDPIYTMLLEEAYLRERIPIADFYDYMPQYTSAEWVGPPKGQIEPVKEIQADERAIALRVKSRRMVALENAVDIETVIEQIDEEEADLAERGLLKEESNQSAQTITDEDERNDNE